MVRSNIFRRVYQERRKGATQSDRKTEVSVHAKGIFDKHAKITGMSKDDGLKSSALIVSLVLETILEHRPPRQSHQSVERLNNHNKWRPTYHILPLEPPVPQ
jgi:hypothetical protein